MPTTRTAEKEMRAAERRKEGNKSVRSETKTIVTKAEGVISGGDINAAKAEVKAALRALDKETKKGRSHRNNAARRKSRLVRKLNRAEAAAKGKKE